MKKQETVSLFDDQETISRETDIQPDDSRKRPHLQLPNYLQKHSKRQKDIQGKLIWWKAIILFIREEMWNPELTCDFIMK